MEYPIFKIESINGGRMNKCFLIQQSNKNYFMKEHSDFVENNCPNKNELFLRESESLKYLSNLGFKVPKVIRVDNHCLILEFLDFIKNINSLHYVKLARVLASLHSVSNDRFGFQNDSFLGFISLKNQWTTDWTVFFTEQRWKPMFDLLLSTDQKLLPLWVLGMKVNDLIKSIFSDLKVTPSLLHGDMNPGNWSIDQTTNQVVLFDAFCYYGHNWYDIAALVCWKNLGHDFILTYNSLVTKNLEINFDHPCFILYKAYIYLSGYFLEKNKSLLRRCEKLCKKLINLYPTIYPTLAPKIHKDTKFLLVQCGSFNPLHENHLRNLKLAAPVYNDAQCVIIPASDSRIKQKCKNLLFDFSQRVQFIKDAITSFPFEVYIDLSQLFGPQLIQHLSQCMPGVTIVMVCGADTYLYNRRHIPHHISFVVIERNHYAFDEKQLHKNDILISNDGETTISSTAIRSFWFNEK